MTPILVRNNELVFLLFFFFYFITNIYVHILIRCVYALPALPKTKKKTKTHKKNVALIRMFGFFFFFNSEKPLGIIEKQKKKFISVRAAYVFFFFLIDFRRVPGHNTFCVFVTSAPDDLLLRPTSPR